MVTLGWRGVQPGGLGPPLLLWCTAILILPCPSAPCGPRRSGGGSKGEGDEDRRTEQGCPLPSVRGQEHTPKRRLPAALCQEQEHKLRELVEGGEGRWKG